MDEYFTPELHRTLIKGILSIVTTILTDAGIKYWIDGGSLLGAVRDGDMIPWDDDADIGMDYKDYMTKLPKLYEIIKRSAITCNDIEYKLYVEIHSDMVKVFIPDMWVKTPTRIIGTPTLDLFPWRKSGDRVELYSAKQRKQFKNCFYLKSELFPLKEYKFGTYTLLGANEPMGYLNRYYGPDCMTTGKIEVRAPTEQCATQKADEMIEFKL